MNSQVIDNILHRYGDLLQEIDTWFADCMARLPDEIACKSGCTGCCRALFDITLLDAAYLGKGFDGLDSAVRETVRLKAEERFASLRKIWPELGQPYLLNHRPEEDWEELMPDDDETPCLLLGDDGRCLVYGYRPMTCRLHGVPLVDCSGEVFMEEWCTENFRSIDPMKLENIRWKFFTHFSEELELFREFTGKLLGRSVNELDTFIPLALLIDFDELGKQKAGNTESADFADCADFEKSNL